MSTIDLLKAKLGMVNWQFQIYKILLVLVIAAGASYFIWDNGKDYGYRKCNAETVDNVIDGVNERLPVIQQAERGAARMEQELKSIKENLDEEVDRPVDPDCGISDEQLRLYNDAASKTRR